MFNSLSLPWRGWLRQRSITLARGGERPPREPVVVYRAANVMEAEVVAARLTAAGIPSWRRAETLGRAYGLTIGPLAQVDILVPAALAEHAQAVLAPDPLGDDDAP